MVSITLNNNKVHTWKKYTNGYVKGYAFEGVTLLTEDEIYYRCSEAYSHNKLKEFLHELNGYFSIILSMGERTILIADKLKTYPLFYFKTPEGYGVADLSDTVLAEISSASLAPIAVKEYVSAGYVSENKTLLRDCLIVPTASFVCIEEGHTTETRYYSQHLLVPIQETEATRIASSLNPILERVMQRMRQVANGRTIVIPLSGGYDSRLIACLCKKYEIPNVICYTYGIKGSPEIEISRKVAEKLSLPWFYVEYTSEKWARLINSPLFEAYIRYGGNLNTIPHIQDLLAISELLNNHSIPEGAMVVPGHTGDAIGGSHLPARIKKNAIGKEIYEKYFEINVLKRKYQKEIIAYLNETIASYFPLHTEEDCLQAFHAWNIRTRQANFIINSVRAYELKGLDWYLPLWDNEFEQFWNAIPCQRRIGSRLYTDYLFKEFFEPYGVNYYKPSSEVSLPLFIRILRKIFPARERSLIKRRLSEIGLYAYPQDRNALDIVGELIRRKEFNKENEYISYSKPNSMCMKSLFYLSLLHK
ncbi:MAG: asparagine synthase-related protein [Parabacteroides sp.]|nr:asparagine synthase-related protein [Parabacteroides sp.]